MEGIKNFDVFVIGTGTAGQLVAKACVEAGLTVAIADNREYGGTCANRGCDPKKLLLGPTEVFQMSHNLGGKGIAKNPKLDWKKLQKFKKTFTKKIPASTEAKLKGLGIEMYHQSPKFLGSNTLSVEGKTIQAKKIVIATGQVSRTLNIKGEEFLKTSDDFLELKKRPKSILFLGAGYIGLEFAHIAARFGCKVTILEQGAHALNAFDQDLVSELVKASKALGIEFIYNAEVLELEKLNKNYKVHYKSGARNKTIKARMVFNTTGRVPAIEDLALEKGLVAFTEAGVKVNAYMQNTENPDVYACGDVADHSLPLTPLSVSESIIVADNIIYGNKTKIETPEVPSVVFTLPNLATVGLSEFEAKKRYKNVIVNYQSVPHWYNAKRIGERHYAYKVLLNERTNQIVGAHLLGPHAGETINLFAMAIHMKLTANDLKKMIFTYPSWTNDIKSMLAV
ncbi:dihydrolipoyl dehydrogenase family protein [Mariniflexile ostreae]|uniref:Dihydrolipoyl dehydrogenase family protein n=1 Tax=Mariniflexile ostreae TaxID=1520892 RepID=A0ABV5F8P9_9FLAO